MFPGFNRSKKRGTISRGDFDRDGVSNRKDCEPMNYRKQGPEHESKKYQLTRFGDSYTLAKKIGIENFERLYPNNRWIVQIKQKMELAI